jgi:hypothetical protein
VCTLSDVPPAYFLCDEPVFSSTETPTATPAPTSLPPNVLLQVTFDDFPFETSVNIYNTSQISVFTLTGPSIEGPSAVKTVPLSLEVGMEYTMRVTDTVGDGREFHMAICTSATSIRIKERQSNLLPLLFQFAVVRMDPEM